MNIPASSKLKPYERLLFEDLGIPKDFLSDQQKAEKIRKKLLAAGQVERSGVGDLYAIEVCLHIASSIVLLESNAKNLDATLRQIKTREKDYADANPEAVVTSAALCYLLTEANTGATSDERDALDYLLKRLDSIHWGIGEKAMETLGIP